jgi:hypothetical protein
MTSEFARAKLQETPILNRNEEHDFDVHDTKPGVSENRIGAFSLHFLSQHRRSAVIRNVVANRPRLVDTGGV